MNERLWYDNVKRTNISDVLRNDIQLKSIHVTF